MRGGLERPLEDVLRDTPPVAATKRVAPDGSVVAVPLAGRPSAQARDTARARPMPAHSLRE